jgi:arylformamidase
VSALSRGPRPNVGRTLLAALAASLVAASCSGASSGTTAGTSSTTESAPSSTALSTTTTSQPATTSTVCRDSASGPYTFVYARYPGTALALTSLDVYLPAGCGPVPVVIWVHGGAWESGDKRSPGVLGKVAVANGLGAALVALNYRLSTPGSGVQWPDQGVDIVAAIAWLQAVGPGHGLDTEHIVLMGHSAGAHLVSIVATDPDLAAQGGLDPAAIVCVVSLDTEGYDLANSAAEEAGIVAEVFGSDPEVIADASPLIQVERHGAPEAPFLVVTRGSANRRAIAQAFVDALIAGGGHVEAVDAGDYTHNDVNLRLGEPGEQVVTPPVTQFLEGCLADAG